MLTYATYSGLHQMAITRVLYTFARLNPGIRYVQGMNEVRSPVCVCVRA